MMTDINLALFNIINGLAGKNYFLDTVAIFTAKYLIYIFGIYLIYLWFLRSKYRQEVLFAGYAALIGLGINFIITQFYFHPRPFMIPTGTLLIPHAPETSFPSDDTTSMFAISLMLLIVEELRSKGVIFFIFAFIGGLSRVYTGLHFPMDIAGSLFVAIFSAGLLLLLKQYIVPINRIIIIFFGNIEDKLHKR
jgi:undecaprenyl-diphosphatase